MRSVHLVLGVAAGLWLGLGLSPAAPAAELAHGPFTVERVVLEGLRGTLAVRVVEGGETRLTITGPEEAAEALGVRAEAGVLRVTAPAEGRSVTVVDQVTVVTGQGATSNVVIGGNTVTSTGKGSGAALDIVLEVPARTALDLLGFTGKAGIGDLLSPVTIEAVSGEVALGAVSDAVLAAIGNGVVEAASVTGDLSATVTGAGRIAVAGGAIDALRVAVTGAGTVIVAAPARSAVVDMVGDGDVRLAGVAEPPRVNRVGAGRFSAGQP